MFAIRRSGVLSFNSYRVQSSLPSLPLCDGKGEIGRGRSGLGDGGDGGAVCRDNSSSLIFG